jgi:hypothetical protein
VWRVVKGGIWPLTFFWLGPRTADPVPRWLLLDGWLAAPRAAPGDYWHIAMMRAVGLWAACITVYGQATNQQPINTLSVGRTHDIWAVGISIGCRMCL